MKIEVYQSPVSDKVIKTFKSKAELNKYMEKHPNLRPDQVSINGVLLMGWDEYEP